MESRSIGETSLLGVIYGRVDSTQKNQDRDFHPFIFPPCALHIRTSPCDTISLFMDLQA
jgi:hypothetical protein